MTHIRWSTGTTGRNVSSRNPHWVPPRNWANSRRRHRTDEISRSMQGQDPPNSPNPRQKPSTSDLITSKLIIMVFSNFFSIINYRFYKNNIFWHIKDLYFVSFAVFFISRVNYMYTIPATVVWTHFWNINFRRSFQTEQRSIYKGHDIRQNPMQKAIRHDIEEFNPPSVKFETETSNKVFNKIHKKCR